jgi:2-polyprenyl-3-methyl-5-hydroxy-6-metoxy-1,4-benzoquinol methylase
MTSCPACSAPGGRPRYVVRGHTILACPRCAAWYLQSSAPAPGYDDGYLRRRSGGAELRGYYDYEADRGLHLRNFARNLAILDEFAARGTLCDIGCASGHFLSAARASGRFSAITGVDSGPEAIAEVRARVGCEALVGRVETMPPPGRFDVVTMWETIEHIADPVAALTALREWLTPGGVLAIGTGDNASPLARVLGRRWWYLVPPDHCVYFNRTALAAALLRAGLRVLGWRRVWSHWVSSTNLAMKLMRSLDVPPAAALALAARVPRLRVPVLHGTTLVALATRDP